MPVRLKRDNRGGCLQHRPDHRDTNGEVNGHLPGDDDHQKTCEVILEGENHAQDTEALQHHGIGSKSCRERALSGTEIVRDAKQEVAGNPSRPRSGRFLSSACRTVDGGKT